MASAPMPDPSQQPSQLNAPDTGGGDPGAGGTPQGGAGMQAPAPPELMMLARMSQMVKQLAQQVPAASAGLAKATAGINEAMSAIVSQPQNQAPSQSPTY